MITNTKIDLSKESKSRTDAINSIKYTLLLDYYVPKIDEETDDVEWVENQLYKKSPTQLSGVRVNEKWEIIDSFSSFIRPMNSSFYDWEHMAYAGGIPSDFIYAPSCFNVFKSFTDILNFLAIEYSVSPFLTIYVLELVNIILE